VSLVVWMRVCVLVAVLAHVVTFAFVRDAGSAPGLHFHFWSFVYACVPATLAWMVLSNVQPDPGFAWTQNNATLQSRLEKVEKEVRQKLEAAAAAAPAASTATTAAVSPPGSPGSPGSPESGAMLRRVDALEGEVATLRRELGHAAAVAAAVVALHGPSEQASPASPPAAASPAAPPSAAPTSTEAATVAAATIAAMQQRVGDLECEVASLRQSLAAPASPASSNAA
jgi:hypothetical protein